ncbi:MAG TPA: hypothetical protein VHX20_13700 [Terracidiphilus sp.]|nr:hypothetical protein [Terracidiphilus sp.]
MAIENKLRWVVDTGLSEGLDRKRASHATQNFSLLNRIILNLLKQEKSSSEALTENGSKPVGTQTASSRYWGF